MMKQIYIGMHYACTQESLLATNFFSIYTRAVIIIVLSKHIIM